MLRDVCTKALDRLSVLLDGASGLAARGAERLDPPRYVADTSSVLRGDERVEIRPAFDDFEIELPSGGSVVVPLGRN